MLGYQGKHYRGDNVVGIKTDPARAPAPGSRGRASAPTDGAVRAPLQQTEESGGRNEEVSSSLTQHRIRRSRTGQEQKMSAAAPQSELRLVVLGRAGAGTSLAGGTILGLQDSEQGTEASVSQECRKLRGAAAGRRVVVVSSPAWFGSGCSPEERRKHISSFIALSSPGPHAFLLCVPVNQPTDGEAEALAALLKLFGPAAVGRNTIVLFTHTEELEEDERLDEYLATWRRDLQELVESCGGRYHTLETRGGEAGERAVEELLEKVEQAVREEAERSIGDLNVDIDDIFPPTSVSPSPQAPSLLGGLWEKLTGWLMWLPRLVRREALFGALVGLFVGGPFGGMVGATVGSVATEVGRRKTQKTK
uniref:Si:dkeyp-69e1.8 n=1 Tax=Scophthalmus maximus TaxID=52904 RepID=A0A8D3C8G7_SCOMX